MTARSAGRSGAVLYTPAILALAVELARYPLLHGGTVRGSAQSRVCGSRIELSLETGADGTIVHPGAQVTACAIGQAAAALFLIGAAGQDAGGIAAGLAAIEAWLDGEGPLPEWPGIDAMAPARDYPARHGAILLPWKAALVALSNPATAA